MDMYPNNDGGVLTEDQKEYLRRNMPDIVGGEQNMQRQMQLANALRTPTPRGMDWASQLARGIQGTYGGFEEGRRDKAHRELRGSVQRVISNMPGARRGSSSDLPFAGSNDEYGRVRSGLMFMDDNEY